MENPRIEEDRVRERAYSLWEAEGCPDGCAERHWQQAEAELFQTGEGQDMVEARNAGSEELGEDQDAVDAPVRSRRRA